ncbi:MAG: carboxypeptidase-like regulatory domain-containing protein [Cytophagales bacterium]|nr:MAG: carboxypeptidase-like regulatory domain-containing protein [Cytophagales bacterium]TAF61906.1 MAG: carboxypeptidase-like regulatory domain-containing protein [Cytophagales bacterium]
MSKSFHTILKVLCLLFFISGFSSIVLAQNEVSGHIKDAETGEVLAFVNISTNGVYGTNTNVNGYFKLKIRQEDSVLMISYVGYERQRLQIKGLTSPVKILLKPTADNLDEVVVSNGENPANRIIRQVIKNKNQHDPLKMKSFSYRSYNKFVWAPYSTGVVPVSSVDTLLGFFKDKHLLVMETISRKKFKAPNLQEEEIVATKMSGLPNPPFADLVSNYQTFGFYEDLIQIYQYKYINPISEGTFRRYNFFIEDSLFRGNDTIFVISYEPQKNKNFEGLKGLLYISTDGYAIQNVIAEAANPNTWLIKIEQEYNKTGGQWFPESFHVSLRIPNYLSEKNGLGLSLEAKSFLSELQVNPDFKNRSFSWLNTSNAKDFNLKDSLYWQQNRDVYLSDKEVRTYKAIDSISAEAKIDKIFNTFSYLANDELPLKGALSMILSKTLRINQYESVRLGMGLQTNNRMSKYFRFGGFAGYGIRDEAWKYGGFAEIHIQKLRDLRLRAAYEREVAEPGQISFLESTPLVVSNSNRAFLASTMFLHQGLKTELSFRPLRYMRLALGYSKLNYDTATFNFTYAYGDQLVQNFDNEEFTFRVRYAYGEVFSQVQGVTVSRGTKAPIFNFYYARGRFDNILNYERYAGRIDKTFFTKTLGNSTFSVEAGQVTADVPYTHLFTHAGMDARGATAFFNIHNFQTMGLYEFMATDFVHIFWKHDFGSLLFKSPKFKPRISLINSYGYGSNRKTALSNHVFFDSPNKGTSVEAPSDYSKGYWESGIHLANLLFSDFRLGKMGFGAGVHYRHGAYQKEKLPDNLAFKVLLEFVF